MHKAAEASILPRKFTFIILNTITFDIPLALDGHTTRMTELTAPPT